MTENQYSFIKNLSDKIDTLDTSVSSLNTFVEESRSSLTLLEDQIKDIRISVEQLIILYNKLKTNSKIIKNQIKVLKEKKQEVETKVKTLQLPLKEAVKKLMKRDNQIKSQMGKINKRNNYYKQIILTLKEYDKQIKKLIPEDYDTLRNQVIVDFEKTIEDLQFIKKSVWNKTKRLVTVDDNLDRIRDLLKKYSTIDEKIPNIINEVRKKEGVKKDAFLKKITKN